ncbi:MAG TPA: hypothetical protein DCZ04_06675 [Syntrophorhabdus aromaticivorans]|nr:hypothetical protein [Syntrophorhabdus aromaticivorans]
MGNLIFYDYHKIIIDSHNVGCYDNDDGDCCEKEYACENIVIATGSLFLSIICAVIGQLLKKAIDIKEENDLTF